MTDATRIELEALKVDAMRLGIHGQCAAGCLDTEVVDRVTDSLEQLAARMRELLPKEPDHRVHDNPDGPCSCGATHEASGKCGSVICGAARHGCKPGDTRMVELRPGEVVGPDPVPVLRRVWQVLGWSPAAVEAERRGLRDAIAAAYPEVAK